MGVLWKLIRLNNNMTYRTYTTYKTYMTYAALIVIIASFFPMPKTALAAALTKAPNNLSLVGYWPLDDNLGYTASDVSGNGNTGTISAATWANGKHGKALSFPGTGSPNVDVSTAGNLNFGTGSFSVSMWGYFRDFTYPKAWFMIKKSTQCYNGGGDPGWDIGHSYNSNGINICYTDGTNLVQNGSVTFDNGYKPADLVNKWAHLIAVFDKSANSVKFYVNGVKQTNEYDISSVTGTVSGSDNLTIGTMYGWQTDGILDDVRLYSRALSASEVSAMYRSGQITRKAVSESGLVGYWPMNEGVGLQAGDSSGYGYTGTIAGNPTWTDGKRGKALNFDGTGDVITATDGLSGNGAFTASAWVNPADITTSWKSIFGTGCSGFDVAVNAATINFGRNCGGGVFYTGPTVSANEWAHIVAVFDGTNIDVYKNGVKTTGGAVTYTHGATTYIGGSINTSSELFLGKIDDVRIWNRALSVTEVLNLYKQNETVANANTNSRMTNGLVGLWSFNGYDLNMASTTAEILDRSGSGNNGDNSGGVADAGRIGQGWSFDGVDDYILKSSPAGLNFNSTNEISASAWVKFTPNAYDFWLTMTLSGSIKYRFGSDPSGYPFWDVGQHADRSYTNYVFPSGVWKHVAFTAKSEGANIITRVYVDSVLLTTQDEGITTLAAVDALYIGTGETPTSHLFNGTIDEVRVYNRTLTADEVKQLYNLGK